MTGTPNVPMAADPAKYPEAIAAFRRRVPMTVDEWRELEDSQREYAFTVSGVAQAEIVSQVWDAIDSAVTNGEDFEAFKSRVGDLLTESWGGPNAARLQNIFRTNINSTYNAGRREVFTAPAVREARPYWRFEWIDDDRLCPICEACEGVILPADHPWWDDHIGPLHFSCFPPSMRVRTLGGWKPIGSVGRGDLVLSHDGGYHPVANVMVTRHEGSLRVIRDAKQILYVTPNHPLAAKDRWIRADALDVQRDQLWILKRTTSVAHDLPSLSADESALLLVGDLLGRGRVPLSPVEFHQDAMRRDSEVTVEETDRDLRNVFDPEARHRLGHRAFMAAAMLPLLAVRNVKRLLQRSLAAASRHVCGCNLQLATAGVHRLVSPSVVLGDRSSYASLREQSIDRRPTAVVALGQGNSRLPREVERDHFLLDQRNRLLSTHDFALSNIDSSEVKYNGDIINLDVEGSRTFVVEGFLVHNCRCSFTALSPGEADDEGVSDSAPGAASDPDEGFGDEPSTDGTDWQPTFGDYAKPIRDVLKDEIE